jgi:streptogrisin C
VATDAVRVVASEEAPRPLADVRGGDAYYINNSSRCSVGFPVVGGFVSAGHCGQPGSRTTGTNRTAQGTFQGSSFPGNDYSWVKVNSNWTPRGVVNRYNGGTVPVRGSQEASVGAAICRSGSTTGWHCGTVGAKNSTVRYAEGAVSGLTRTNVCAEPGDSGGSWISGDQAQGVTSGGSGNCSSGGTTYFQPVNEILSAYSLRLVTS